MSLNNFFIVPNRNQCKTPEFPVPRKMSKRQLMYNPINAPMTQLSPEDIYAEIRNARTHL